MTVDVARLADPTRFAELRLPAHSDHIWHRDEQEAARGVTSFIDNLNGTWKFHHADSPATAPEGFERPDHDCSGWDDIRVPAHVEMEGHGRPQYCNIQYPWDGHEAVEPGAVPVKFNPVASYARTFALAAPLTPGERLSLVFHGAESSVACWVNGTFVGYCEDSFTPSEFDITSAVHAGDNKLAAQVVKWSSGSWLEDQDMYRFSGLFRDVELRRRPAVHAEDVRVTTELSDDFSEAQVTIEATLSAPGTVHAAVPPTWRTLAGVDEGPGDVESGTVQAALPATWRSRAGSDEGTSGGESGTHVLRFAVPSPRLWSAEDPYLYDVLLSVAPGAPANPDPASPSAPTSAGPDGGSPNQGAPLKVGTSAGTNRDAESPSEGASWKIGTSTGETGSPSEVIPLRIGLRRVEIKDAILTINGQRLVFKGVNRHEFGLDGRVMTRERTEEDLKLLKRIGVNAVRTCHYPNNSFFYDLADELGLYVVDEVNLETHGCWDKVAHGEWTLEQALPGDRPEWRAAVLDRAQSLYERDKNHCSVVVWSLGNESLGGTTIRDEGDYFRRQDPSRPVQYEGIHWDPRHPETIDIASQMYTPAAELAEWLKTHRDKPFILQEYAHAMGNSFGAVAKYMDLAHTDPIFHGAFIWDFADQAILLKDRFGQEYFGYGGDCGEAPHDNDFCGNGIVYADHSESPKVQEVRHVYQPFRIAVWEDGFEVENRHLFTNSSVFDCLVTLSRDGLKTAESLIDTNVAPGETRTYSHGLDRGKALAPDGEWVTEVSFRLKEATPYAPAGWEVAWQQAVLPPRGGALPTSSQARPDEVAPTTQDRSDEGALTAQRRHDEGAPTAQARPDEGTPIAWSQHMRTAARDSAPAPELVVSTHNIGVHGDHFTALFSRIYGGLTSYRHGPTPAGGRELLQAIPFPNFWHAPTSNERGWQMGFRDAQWLGASRYPFLARVDGSIPSVTRDDESVTVLYEYVLPTTPPSSCDMSYQVFGDGRVLVTTTVRPGAGLPDMPEFSVLLKTSADFHNLTWYGEGPEECYVDRRLGARLGLHHGDVATQLTPYLRPQEAGNHTGVRWARVTDDAGAGLLFECDPASLTPSGPTTDPSADTTAPSLATTSPSPDAASPSPRAGRGVLGMEFSALPWTPFEVENAAHAHNLPPVHSTVLRPALMRRGVGGDDSWGAETHPEYRLPTDQELTFRFSFRGIG
ncbi:MAG: DUF4981 domain-containing protein [Propionibacteriaceae bacterium]|jgi:beta-galactosidase|nr:DUF4981 domain-containing protein [Propionibacteriaceae bacterium]